MAARHAPASPIYPPVAVAAPGAGNASDAAEGSSAASWDLSPFGFVVFLFAFLIIILLKE